MRWTEACIGGVMSAEQPAADGTFRLACNMCKQQMAAPVGSTKIQCPHCTMVNVLVPCGNCKVHLSFLDGAKQVKCSSCGSVNTIN